MGCTARQRYAAGSCAQAQADRLAPAQASKRRDHLATPELSTRYTLNIPHATTALAAFTMVALASLGGHGALAATNDEQTDELAHTVKDGDTLEGLARSYLAAPRQWPLLQARNKVANPRHLLPGSVIWIPVRLQPSEFATVQFVQGSAQASPPQAPVQSAEPTLLPYRSRLAEDYKKAPGCRWDQNLSLPSSWPMARWCACKQTPTCDCGSYVDAGARAACNRCWKYKRVAWNPRYRPIPIHCAVSKSALRWPSPACAAPTSTWVLRMRAKPRLQCCAALWLCNPWGIRRR